MLLRRITQHVKDQNWFAVLIDFAIVVFGVFIGIQVSNWNATRAEDARIAAQLNSFRNELILARDDFASRQVYYEDRFQSVTELRNRLESGRDLSAEDFNRLAVSAIRGGGLNMSFRGFEEMTATGAISKLGNAELRDLIHAWDTSFTNIKNTDVGLENVRNGVLIPIVLETTSFGNIVQADARYQDFPVTERLNVDVEDIRANRPFDNALAMRQVMAKQQLNALVGFIATTEELIAALEEEGRQ